MIPESPVLLSVLASLILLGEGVLLLRRIFWTPKPVSDSSSDKETLAHYQATRETRAIATETRDLVRAIDKAILLAEARSEEHARIMTGLQTSIESNTAVLHELLAVLKNRRS